MQKQPQTLAYTLGTSNLFYVLVNLLHFYLPKFQKVKKDSQCVKSCILIIFVIYVKDTYSKPYYYLNCFFFHHIYLFKVGVQVIETW